MDDKQERHTSRISLLLQRVGNWLKGAGELRDGFLVTVGIFYFFGYIVWAINAYRNNLGLLPALEFQYFIAGVVPVSILLVLYFIVVGIKLLEKKVTDWLGPSPTGWKLYLCWGMFGLGIIALVLIVAINAEWFKAVFPNSAYRPWLALICTLLIMLSSFFLSPLETALETGTTTTHISEHDDLQKLGSALFGVLLGFLNLAAWLYAFIFLIVLPVLAFIFFVVDLYPKIPQEFGGARPHYACLDIVKAQISNETIEGILPLDANKLHEPVVRSLRVEVLFSGSDVTLVRSQGKIYKITKSTIQSITNCD